MNFKNRKNNLGIISIWVSQISAVLLNSLMQFSLASILQPNDYGNLVTILTVVNILISIGSFGVGQYIIQHISKKEIVYNSFFVLIIINITLLLVMYVTFSMTDNNIIKNITYFSTIIISGSLLSYTLCIYQYNQSFVKYSTLYFSNHLYRILIIVIPILLGVSIEQTYEIQFILGFFLFIIYLVITYINFKKLYSNLNFKIDLRVFFDILPYASTTILFLVYQYVNVLFINIFLNATSAANYFLSFSILTLFYLLPNSLFSIFFLPKIHLFKQNDEINSFIKNMEKKMLILGVISIILYISVGYVISLTSFGEKYNGMFSIICAMSVLILIKFVSSIYGGILNRGDLIVDKVRTQFFMFLINIGMNIIFINIIGVFGSVLSLIVSELFFLYLSKNKIRKRLR